MIAAKGQKPFNSGLLSNFGDEGIIDNFISFFGKIACQLPNCNPKNMGGPLSAEPLGQPILQGGATFKLRYYWNGLMGKASVANPPAEK